MANTNILTTDMLGTQVRQTYSTPSAQLTVSGRPINTVYCFLSRVDAWSDDTNPPTPTQDQRYLKSTFKNMFLVKKITSGEISPVIRRHDWVSGKIFDYYRDDVDMFQSTEEDHIQILTFYAKNKYDQVWKCLWNGSGSPATDEPVFQPGTFGIDNIYTGTDGYKWKYMYSIDVGQKRSFMDETWMPIPIGTKTINPLESPVGSGGIEVINVVYPGSGYDPANSSIECVVSGDGTNAAGYVVTTGDKITDVVVTNQGMNYSSANVALTPMIYVANGAICIAPASPIGGHGYDPFSELGCRDVMFSVEFNSDESGYLPVDIDYRQVGLLVDPIAQSSIGPNKDYTLTANSSVYRVTTDLTVAAGFGSYISDETIYQGTSVYDNTFSATVLSYNATTNIIKLINIQGTPALNTPVFGYLSGTVRTLLSVDSPDFIIPSGKIIYIDNISGVQRSSDGIELFKFVLQY